MASPDQLNSYHSQCSDISFTEFSLARSTEYDPSSADYYEDVIRDNGSEGAAVSLICLAVFLALIIFNLVLCCVPHHWVDCMDFISIARKGHYWWQRLLGLLFVLGIICCTVLVAAMSIWGIVRVVQDVQDVVPESFDFLEDTKQQLDSIHGNLTAAVENGNNIVVAVRLAVDEVRTDPGTVALTTSDVRFNETFTQVLSDLSDSTDEAEDALETVDTEVNENLDEILDGMRDAVGYRDEGEEINDLGRIVVIIAFSFFILFSVGSTIFSLCGVSARCTLFWAAVMWFMLIIAFWLVGVLDISKEISRDTCLYIDTYAVQELKDEVNRDPQRTEQLIWYYFRSPGNGTKTLEQLEDLWSFPLTDVMSFLNIAEEEIFEGEGLRFPYSSAQLPTQEALLAVRRLIPQARLDIKFVQDLIEGDTFHTIHSDFKDLVCCTEYESVDAVWTAWVVSSVFGLVLALLMTLQGFLSLRCGRRTSVPLAETAIVLTQKTSAYMAPPVAEGLYATGNTQVAERNESGEPLRKKETPSSSAVKYPTIRPADAYF